MNLNELAIIRTLEQGKIIIESSLLQINKWTCDTGILEDILVTNHRGWEILFKALRIINNGRKYIGHNLDEVFPEIRIGNDVQNLESIFFSQEFRDYFILLGKLVDDTESRYKNVNDMYGMKSKHYVLDEWIRNNPNIILDDLYTSAKNELVDINNISLRYIYMALINNEAWRRYSVVFQKWSKYWNDRFYPISY